MKQAAKVLTMPKPKPVTPKPRQTKPPGWEAGGWRFFVRVKGYPAVLSFRIDDPDHRLTLKERKDAKADFAAKKRAEKKLPVPAKGGTFAEDVREKYYGAMQVDDPDERKHDMEYWIAHFGDCESLTIESWQIAERRNFMLEKGPYSMCVPWDAEHPKPEGCTTGRRVLVEKPLSPARVAKRMRALQNFFTVVYPQKVPNPVKQAGEPDQVEREPKGLPYALLEAILAKMPNLGRAAKGKLRPDESLSKLRLRAIAFTGYPHSTIKRIKAEHLHVDDEPFCVLIKGRKKGSGTKDVTMPLLAEGAAALRALRDAGGLGGFSNSSLWKAFKTALAKVPQAPQTASPYSFRHAFGEEVLDKTENLTAVQLLLLHNSERMAKHYAKGKIDPVRAALVRQLEAAGFGKAVEEGR